MLAVGLQDVVRLPPFAHCGGEPIEELPHGHRLEWPELLPRQLEAPVGSSGPAGRPDLQHETSRGVPHAQHDLQPVVDALYQDVQLVPGGHVDLHDRADVVGDPRVRLVGPEVLPHLRICHDAPVPIRLQEVRRPPKRHLAHLQDVLLRAIGEHIVVHIVVLLAHKRNLLDGDAHDLRGPPSSRNVPRFGPPWRLHAGDEHADAHGCATCGRASRQRRPWGHAQSAVRSTSANDD
mmetsp:Transcript_90130/g.259890  ORF Transcript_90130/g.259890 Transcript_90130/m.259890 type:complete len:235 (+) Transcript_90130:415-1119(+)